MADFKIVPGAEYVKTFDTLSAGQVVVTLVPNDFGNACLTIGRATDEGIKEVTVGISGARAENSDQYFVEAFNKIDGEKALAAWEKGTAELIER